jgi:tetratricopeptide (TPR) repeat protein
LSTRTLSDLATISILSDLYVKAGRIKDATVHLLRVAETFLCSGSTSSANYVLKKVLKIDPSNPIAHMNMGELYLKDRSFEQAHESFLDAGAGFWHIGDVAASIRMNDRALETMPNSRRARVALAIIHRESNQSAPPKPRQQPTKQVVGDLPEIIISIDDGSDAVCAPGEFGDGQWQGESTSDKNKSQSQTALTPTRDQDSIVEQIATAECLVGCGQLDQALALLRQLLLDAPDNIQIREKLKDIYLRSEMIDRASEECANIAAVYFARRENRFAEDYLIRARLLSSVSIPTRPIVSASEAETGLASGNDGANTVEQPLIVM